MNSENFNSFLDFFDKREPINKDHKCPECGKSMMVNENGIDYIQFYKPQNNGPTGTIIPLTCSQECFIEQYKKQA